MLRIIIILSQIGIICHLSVGQTESLVVNTISGLVRGKRFEHKSKFNQRPINAFIGIPYARPPVGNNRFRPPQPVEIWSGEKDVTNHRVMCPQVYQRFNYHLNEQIREDEDCLYLNVFVPTLTRPTHGFPVMVYIHGGQFQFSGKDFYPPQYLLDQDVILVTFNYRLSVLGFLSTGDDNCQGNFGIQDQIAALKWVSSNINNFGGNSNNITLFGHDSGAVSISILLTSSQSWGLYQNVMIISGSVFAPNAVSIPDPKSALDFGRAVNCDFTDLMIDRQNSYNFSQKLIDCLRTKPFQELISVSRLPGLYPNTFQFNFGPVVDRNTSSPILIDDPIHLFQSGNYWKTPMVSGIAANEGSLDYFLYYDKIKDWTLSEKLNYLFGKFNYNEFYTKILTKSVDWFYFKRLNDSINTYNGYEKRKNFQNINLNNNLNLNIDWAQQEREEQGLIDAIGDFTYGSANTLLLDIHSLNSKNTYLYVIEHRGLKTFGTLQRNGSQIVHRNQYGVTHMDDIFYIFPTLYSDDSTSTYDEPLIRQMCQNFAYFAKYGKFTPTNGIHNHQLFGNYWTPYSQQNPYYMKFLSSNSQILRGFRTDYYAFWNYFIRELFDDIYAKRTNETQITAQFIGTVQLRGMIKFGDNKFVIN